MCIRDRPNCWCQLWISRLCVMFGNCKRSRSRQNCTGELQDTGQRSPGFIRVSPPCSDGSHCEKFVNEFPAEFSGSCPKMIDQRQPQFFAALWRSVSLVNRATIRLNRLKYLTQNLASLRQLLLFVGLLMLEIKNSEDNIAAEWVEFVCSGAPTTFHYCQSSTVNPTDFSQNE